MTIKQVEIKLTRKQITELLELIDTEVEIVETYDGERLEKIAELEEIQSILEGGLCGEYHQGETDQKN